MAGPGDGGFIVRNRLLGRLAAPRARVVLLNAPAGYGKSVLARQFAAQFPATAVCDCYGVEQRRDLAVRILGALAHEDPWREIMLSQQRLGIITESDLSTNAIEMLLVAWRHEGPKTAFIVENAEAITQSLALLELFEQLVAEQPATRTIVVCSRVPLRLRPNRFVPPHALVRLGSADLAFTREEIVLLLADHDLPQTTIERIATFSRGWAVIALLLARLARERDIQRLLARLDDIELSDLHEYLSAEIVSVLQQRHLDALLLCAALPFARIEDFMKTLQLDEKEARALLRDLPFVSPTADGTLEIHPVLKSSLERDYGNRMRSLLRDAAEAWRGTDSMRGAEIFASLGEFETALGMLLKGPWLQRFTEAGIRAIGMLPADFARRDQRVFAAYFGNRRYLGDPSDALREAKSVWESLGRPRDNNALLFVAHVISRATESGDLALAESLFDNLPLRTDAFSNINEATVLAYIRAHFLAHAGKLADSEEIIDRLAVLLCDVPFFLGQILTVRGAWIERSRGERERERKTLDEAIEQLKATVRTNLLAGAVLHAAIGAWLADEAGELDRHLAHLEALIADGMVAFEPVVAALRGRDDVDDATLAAIHHHDWRAYAALAMAARAASDSGAAAYARHAVAAAERSGQPFVQVMAWLALSLCVPEEREAARERARNCADRVEAPQLHAALVAESAGGGVLSTFARRFRQRSPKAQPRVYVSFFDIDVSVDGCGGQITDRQVELLMAIASRPRGARLDELNEMLWPQLDAVAARDAFRSCLYRLRRRIPEIVVHERHDDRYRIGATVVSDLVNAERRVRVLSQGALDSEQRAELCESLTRIHRGDRSRAERWEWFIAVEQRIRELGREIANRLAWDALEQGRSNDALEHAQTMIAFDPADESAREIAIRAYLGLGDRTSAAREYRRYRELLRVEFDAEPPDVLRRLIAEAAEREPVNV